MDTIDLKRIFHRGKECVGLYFYNNPTLNNLVQKLSGVKWSQTMNDKLPDAGELTFFFAKELGLQTYAMIQTDYFAGIGTQNAMLFADGHAVSENSSINNILRTLGVVAEKDKDEFDTLNLGDYRESESYYYIQGNRAESRTNMIAGRIPENYS